MNGKHILFDLDGTLTDSGEGIINCASLALAHFGIPVPDRQTMRAFVGPPLSETFESFGVPAHLTDAAIAVYRSRYTTVGKFENTPYPGIRELLEDLKAQEHHLYVATSKPEGLAQEILEKFELSKYFDQICGATLDKSRSKKEDVIAYLLSQVQTDQNTVMVGDTVYDIIGAAIHGVPAVGVSWGYGNVADMHKSGAVAIADTPADLLIILNSGL